MANISTSTISSNDGDQIAGNSGTYTYNGASSGIGFIVLSDTAGVITGKTSSGKTLSVPIAAYNVSHINFVSIDNATTRAGALASATLIAIPV